MSNRHPLQDADRSFDPSVNRGSTVADRRTDDQNPYTDEQPGRNAAPSGASPLEMSWVPGQLPPVMHQPPYSCIHTEGDAGIPPAVVHEVETCKYGDDYDPTAPLRVRDVTSKWKFDSDHDGQPN